MDEIFLSIDFDKTGLLIGHRKTDVGLTSVTFRRVKIMFIVSCCMHIVRKKNSEGISKSTGKLFISFKKLLFDDGR